MIGLSTVGNYTRYLISNWIIVTVGFVLLLMTVLVVGSFVRINNDSDAQGYAYGNGYGNNNSSSYGAYPLSCKPRMYYNTTSRSCVTVPSNPTACRAGMYFNTTSRSCVTYPQAAYTNYYQNGAYNTGYRAQPVYNQQQVYPTYRASGYPSGCSSGCSQAARPTYPTCQANCGNYPGYNYSNNGYAQNRPCTSGCAAANHGNYYNTGYVNKNQGCQNKCGNYNGYYKKDTNYDKCSSRCGDYHKDKDDYYDKGHTHKDNKYDKDDDDETVKVENGNTIDNSSSATATANVVINQAATPQPIATTVGYTQAAPVENGKGGPVELPKTGVEDPIVSLAGLGGLVAAGTAYASSRRELTSSIFKRN